MLGLRLTGGMKAIIVNIEATRAACLRNAPRAMNYTTRKVRTEATRKLAGDFAIKQALIRKRIKTTPAATAANRRGTVRMLVKPISAISLGAGEIQSSGPDRDKIQVARVGKHSFGPHAFIQTPRKGGKPQLFSRVGRERYPIVHQHLTIKPYADSTITGMVRSQAHRWFDREYKRLMVAQLKRRF